jgi:hypothetical protein
MRNINMKPIEAMLANEVRPEDLAARLDHISYQYARYALESRDIFEEDDEVSEASEDLFYLRMLRIRLLESIKPVEQ